MNWKREKAEMLPNPTDVGKLPGNNFLYEKVPIKMKS